MHKKEKLNAGKLIDEGVDIPVLDTLVNEVATGQRILIFPPGVFIYIFAMLLVPMPSLVFLVGGSLNWLGSDLSIPQKAMTQLISIPISMLFTYGPGFLVVHGKKKYVEVTRYYYRFLQWTSLIFLAYYAIAYNELNTSFLWGGIISSFGLWLMRTTSYVLYVEFVYRLKKRKLEIYAEEQKDSES